MTAKKEEVKEEVKEAKVKKATEADMIWDEIKNKPIFLFGLPAKKLQDVVKRVDIAPNEVHLKLNAVNAVVAAIDDSLNMHGSEKRLELFDIKQTANGMLVITRITSRS